MADAKAIGTAFSDALMAAGPSDGPASPSASAGLQDAVRAAALEYLNTKGDAQISRFVTRATLIVTVVGVAVTYAVVRSGARP